MEKRVYILARRLTRYQRVWLLGALRGETDWPLNSHLPMTRGEYFRVTDEWRDLMLNCLEWYRFYDA